MKKSKIIKNKGIMHGAPVIKGTRIPVSAVLSQLKVGIGNGDKNYIKKVYPQLSREDIVAALEYAVDKLRKEMGA